MGAAMAGAAVAVAAALTRRPIVARNFFNSAPAKKAFDPAAQAGVQDPVGFWDPAGYTTGITQADFNRYRSIELKHGRIAMLATMGYITPEITGKLPGDLDPQSGLKFADIPNGLQAIGKVPVLGWAQILAYMAFTEVSSPGGAGGDVAAGTPGDVGWLTGYYSDTRRNAELANGRLAMMAFVGMVFQDGLTGSAWGDWALYTASPLRFFGGGAPAKKAFDPAAQAGVQDPVGFWDPAGYTTGITEADFNRYRSIELKHGRIAMLATMGYITPEITGKLPGDLDPQSGLKFADIPNGLQAIGKVPVLGWAQILAYMAFTEVSSPGGAGGDVAAGTPGDVGWLTGYYSDTRRNAELANGRLAMMAFVGMVFQDGLTGSAWGDWALYTASPLRAFGSSRVAKEARSSVVARRAESIAATAVANGNFKTLVAALTKADLVKTVEGGTFTVFAPTDAAFAALLKELGVTADQLLANPDLKSILLYHVVAGTALSSSLKDGQQVGTAQGGKLAVKIGGGKVTVGGATVTAADIACTNGVIHVIDKVLLPPGKFSPSKQVGVTAPFGFFDPAGFSKEGDEAGFRNLRISEIKHGRVAMMAALGAVAQHFLAANTAPGVPAGLGAVTAAPAGFAALFLASGALEFTLFKQEDNKEPGNFNDPAGLGDYSLDSRNRELNNGRFAMFAAIGIIAAELLTGKDAVQQFGL